MDSVHSFGFCLLIYQFPRKYGILIFTHSLIFPSIFIVFYGGRIFFCGRNSTFSLHELFRENMTLMLSLKDLSNELKTFLQLQFFLSLIFCSYNTICLQSNLKQTNGKCFNKFPNDSMNLACFTHNYGFVLSFHFNSFVI